MTEKMTLRNVLVAVVEGAEITEEMKERAKAELATIDRKNEKAKVRRAEKQAEKADDVKVLLDTAVEILKEAGDEGLTLDEIAEKVGASKQKIQLPMKNDSRFEAIDFKVSKTDSNGKKRTTTKKGYKLA